MINQADEAKSIVSINNLEWSKPQVKPVKFNNIKIPKGWRLPTIQELWTAVSQETIADGNFWSRDKNQNNHVWVGCFGLLKGIALCINSDTIENRVVFVREI